MHNTQIQKDFDIAIIGAGSAGLTVAAVAAQLNYNVVLIEGHKMGGDCLNYGCIPSKAFLYASNKYKDFSKTMDHIKKSIEFIEPHDSVERFEKLGVKVINGFASFIDNENILVNGETITAKKMVIATGSSAYIPFIKGLENIEYLTNESVFSLQEQPKSIAILGAGPIGIEMAIAFNNLGVKTTIINNRTGILLNDDQELTELLKQKLIRDGIDFFEDTNLTRVSKSANGIDLALESGGDEFILSASHFLIATGRTPNTKNLNLDNANIQYNEKGFITTTNYMQTTNKNVYALGDVAGAGLFTHIASYQASIFIKRVLFGSIFAKANYNGLGWTTYSTPELSQIGLTEEKAKRIYGNKIKVFKADFKENDRAITEDAKLGKAKLVLDKKGRVLGVSMLGKNSGELIQQWSQIVQNRQKPSKMLKQIYTYPTYSDINKLLASKVYKELFLSKKTRFISKLLFKYIGNKI
jgi:pyruvate/2-oxoglutarate dehydrogenase complex dihydrolipoamide dehydrogenase (E3) component